MLERPREGCVFCEIIGGTRSGLVIAKTDRSIAFMSLEGHPLVTPLHHVDDSNIDTCLFDMIDAYALANRLIPAVRKIYGVSAVNLLENRGRDAGQEISHFHIHIIPRRKADKALSLKVNIKKEDERIKIADLLKSELESIHNPLPPHPSNLI